MTEHTILFGFILFVSGLSVAIFNDWFARVGGTIGRTTGQAFSGEKYHQFSRTVNIIGGILCASGGLLLMLGINIK